MSNLIKPLISRDLKRAKMHFWTKFGNPNYNRWWLIMRTSSTSGKVWLLTSITVKTMGILINVLWSKFGDSSLNRWQMIARTHRQIQATTIAEGPNWPRVKKLFYLSIFWRTSNVISYLDVLNNYLGFVLTCQESQCILRSHILELWYWYIMRVKWNVEINRSLYCLKIDGCILTDDLI